MNKAITSLAFACLLSLTPACASLRAPPLPNPVAAAQTLDQRAYALLHTYAAVIEEATDIVRDPNTPLAFSRVLGQAERIATPAAEALEIAIAGYLRARADFEAARGETQPAVERAALALSIASQRLNQAIVAAEAPVAELQHLVRARG